MGAQWDQWLTTLEKLDPLLTAIIALATLLTTLGTIALVGATAWIIGRQTKRDKIAQNTELFLQLRQRASSPEHAARQSKVIALLMHLQERELSTCDLEFSPDINLYLNDYQWIGSLVKDKMINKHYARATYGRELLLLYPELEPYIKKEQKLRHYKTLWLRDSAYGENRDAKDTLHQLVWTTESAYS